MDAAATSTSTTVIIVCILLVIAILVIAITVRFYRKKLGNRSRTPHTQETGMYQRKDIWNFFISIVIEYYKYLQDV